MKLTSIKLGLALVITGAFSAQTANAYDGVDSTFAQELEEDAGAVWVTDEVSHSTESSLKPVGYETVSHHEEQYCTSCESPSASCGCGNEKRGVLELFREKRSRKNACPAPWWSHRTSVFGEYLWLRPGSSDLIYATEQTDPDPSIASPTGPIGSADLDAESGFRVGLSLAASQCSSINLSYARWDGSTESTLTAGGANVLASNLIHPSTATSGAASLEAFASHQMNFQTLDLNYRHLWKHTDTMAVNWLAGVRYGNIEQQLSADQTVSVATGLTNVSTDIDFEGFGISGGLDFETYSCTSGLMLYGKTLASLMAGEWNATYDQTNQFGGGVIANRYEDFHATPVLDAELGVRWMAKKHHLVLSTGFLMSTWYESLTTRSYVDAVRAGQLTDSGETMTFSGLTARAEWRF